MVLGCPLGPRSDRRPHPGLWPSVSVPAGLACPCRIHPVVARL
jgi:hypothetical protein